MLLPLHRFALLILFTNLALARAALAQPDSLQRTILPVVEPPPLTPAEIQNLFGAATTITYTGKDVPLNEIVKLFTAKAGLAEPDFPANQPRYQKGKDTPATISVDWKEVPFWTAAQEVEKLTGLRWSPRLKSGVGLVPSWNGETGNLNGMVGAQTPLVKITAGKLVHTTYRTALLGPENAEKPLIDDRSQLSMMVYLDPKLLVESGSITVNNILTSKGETLFPVRENLVFGPRDAYFGLLTPVGVPLPPEVNSGTILSKIGGVAKANVVIASETWKVPDVLQAPRTPQPIGVFEYTLQFAELRDNRLRLRLMALRPKPEGTYSNPTVMFSRIAVRDAQGRPLTQFQSSPNVSRIQDRRERTMGEVVLGRNGETLQGPFSLEWTLPTQTRVINIPFEFQNVTVP